MQIVYTIRPTILLEVASCVTQQSMRAQNCPKRSRQPGAIVQAQIETILTRDHDALFREPTLLHSLLLSRSAGLQAHPEDELLAREFHELREEIEAFAGAREGLIQADGFDGNDVPGFAFLWDEETQDYLRQATPDSTDYLLSADAVEEFASEKFMLGATKALFLVLPIYNAVPTLAVCCASENGARWVEIFVNGVWAQRASLTVLNAYREIESERHTFAARSANVKKSFDDLYVLLEELIGRGNDKESAMYNIAVAAEEVVQNSMELWMMPFLILGDFAAMKSTEVGNLKQELAITSSALAAANKEIESLRSGAR